VIRVSVGTDDSGHQPGRLCVFPFEYEGKQYSDCTNAPTMQGLEWCSVVGGKWTGAKTEWGFCAPQGTCPGDPICSSRGTCNDGTCECDLGFTGVVCERAATQVDVLEHFFTATGARDHWISFGGWDQPSQCSRLFGAACSDKNALTTLELSTNGLDGTIPAEISLLTELRVLDLSNNRLFGEIPTTIGSLIHLEILVLSSNRFVGSIPHTISHLTALKVFDVSNNFLKSPTPIATLVAPLAALSSFSCDDTCIVSPMCNQPKEMCQS